MEERVCQGTVGGLKICGRVDAVAEDKGGRADSDAIFSVVDSSAVWQDVDVGTLGAKLAVSLKARKRETSAMSGKIRAVIEGKEGGEGRGGRKKFWEKVVPPRVKHIV